MTESAKHAVMDAMAVGESVTLTCVAVDTPTCVGCFFVGMDCEMLTGRFRCMASERADGRDVVFVEADKVKRERCLSGWPVTLKKRR